MSIIFTILIGFVVGLIARENGFLHQPFDLADFEIGLVR